MTTVKLVLCDDDPTDLETLRYSAEDYIKHLGTQGEIVCFSAPDDVLRYSETVDENDVAIYLLDVIMPQTGGIELGKKLRERCKNSAIIYISSSQEYALDAFSVHAFSYLIKPFSREKLFSELDECINRTGPGSRKLLIKTAESTVQLELSEIIAVEYLNHRLIFHLAGGEKIESAYRRQPFDVQAEELMMMGEFLKVSASYLVNYRNIQGVKADEFVMRNGACYRITRKYIDARQQYINDEMLNK